MGVQSGVRILSVCVWEREEIEAETDLNVLNVRHCRCTLKRNFAIGCKFSAHRRPGVSGSADDDEA